MIKVTPISLPAIPQISSKHVLCLGFFDGIHRGHLTLIEKGKTNNLPLSLLTFSDETAGLSSPRRKQQLLTPFPIKLQLLEEAGISEVFVLDFNAEVKNLTPTDFIQKILHPLHPAYVIVGDDYRFGVSASGDVTTLLNDQSASFKTVVVPRLSAEDGHFISARAIKELLWQGEVEKAKGLLGRDYELRGWVESGHGRGKTLGFPTANIALLPRSFLPKNGVYIVRVQIKEQVYQGIANIGIHPSVSQLDQPLLEVHLLNFAGDLYEEEVRVFLLKFLRAEKKFSSISQLKSAIASDLESAEHYFAKKTR